jgi:hypothetical protein
MGHCTDFKPICYTSRSKTGVPKTTRSRTHDLVFILAESCCNCCLSCTSKMHSTEDAEGLISAVHSLHWFQTSIWLHSQKQNVRPSLEEPDAHPHAVNLSIIKNLYNADEHMLLDGYKSATVQPSFGAKQGCPLSPCCFPFIWTTLTAWLIGCRVRSLVPPILLWNTCCLLMTFPSLPMNTWLADHG